MKWVRKMKFSVLMSVYKNDEVLFLKRALSSIYEEQTVKPEQIVIVIDGPITSELQQVITNFYNKYEEVVTLVPLKSNVGLGEALRIGTTYCRNEYIFRMDSDDISNKFRFEKQIKFIIENPEIDVIGTNIFEFHTNTDEQMMIRMVPEKHKDIVRLAKKRNPMNHVTVCIKKSSLEKCGGYESLLLLEDYYLWLKMIVSGCTLANINEPLVYVRVGNGFISKRGSKTRIIGWKRLQEYMIKYKLISKYEAFMNMIYINIFVLTPPFFKSLIYRIFLRKQAI